MMAQKNLHELLKEDQEPFLLKNYIADRRCQLKTASPKNQLHLKNLSRPTITQKNSNFPSSFCKKTCFFSINGSPDPRKSPLFNYQSPAKSPKSIFLHVPAKTSALLLEAAVRIQKQSKNRNQTKGLVGTFLKKLTLRGNNNKSKKKEICGDNGVKVSVKDILRWDSSVGRIKSHSNKNGDECEIGFSCSYNGRPSSAVWSESNEEKSFDFDFETNSSSCQSEYSDEFVNCEKQFCESPFRFVLLTPSPGRRTPEFSSPAASPLRPIKEDKENFTVKLQQEQDEEEDKEQCSPVSVLDPPFEDDDDGHYHDLNEEEDDGFDIENSFAIVQRTKHQLLQKLRRFERLAELDPIELEKRMSEQLDDDEEEPESEFDDQYESFLLDRAKKDNDFVKEVMWESGFHHRRLISDLILEEQSESVLDKDVILKKVCERLELWKEVELNTIDMMVQLDFRSEVDDKWKKNQEQVGEMTKEIELAIFGTLIEELGI